MDQVKLKDVNPSCFDCKIANIYRGDNGTHWEPPTPPEAECECPDIDFEDFEEIDLAINTVRKLTGTNVDMYEMYAAHCGKFEPEQIEKCGNCQKEMNVPEYNWPIDVFSVIADGVIPCCSEKCKEELKIKDAEEEEKQNKLFEEWEKRC